MLFIFTIHFFFTLLAHNLPHYLLLPFLLHGLRSCIMYWLMINEKPWQIFIFRLFIICLAGLVGVEGLWWLYRGSLRETTNQRQHFEVRRLGTIVWLRFKYGLEFFVRGVNGQFADLIGEDMTDIANGWSFLRWHISFLSVHAIHFIPEFLL